jgi:hypothetical protein
VNDETAPGLMALAPPAVYPALKLTVFVPAFAEMCHDMMGEIPDPVIVMLEIVVAEPRLFNEIVTLEVALVRGSAVTPPYSVPEERVTVFTLEPNNPNV